MALLRDWEINNREYFLFDSGRYWQDFRPIRRRPHRFHQLEQYSQSRQVVGRDYERAGTLRNAAASFQQWPIDLKGRLLQHLDQEELLISAFLIVISISQKKQTLNQQYKIRMTFQVTKNKQFYFICIDLCPMMENEIKSLLDLINQYQVHLKNEYFRRINKTISLNAQQKLYHLGIVNFFQAQLNFFSLYFYNLIFFLSLYFLRSPTAFYIRYPNSSNSWGVFPLSKSIGD